MKKCKLCNKEIIKSYYESKKSFKKRKFCSQKCMGKYRQKRIIKYCLICGMVIHTWPSHHRKYCSKKCESKRKHIAWNKGKKNPNWIGEKNPRWNNGKMFNKSTGYIYIRTKNHPNGKHCVHHKNISYVAEHHLVMEKHLGRYLKPQEVVHHINGIKTDNRIENLMLFNSKSSHILNHWKNGSYRFRNISL